MHAQPWAAAVRACRCAHVVQYAPKYVRSAHILIHILNSVYATTGSVSDGMAALTCACAAASYGGRVCVALALAARVHSALSPLELTTDGKCHQLY